LLGFDELLEPGVLMKPELDATTPRQRGLDHALAAFAVGSVLAGLEMVGLFSPVGAGGLEWGFAAARLIAAGLFGAWAGRRGFQGRSAKGAFLLFEGPLLVSQGGLALLGLIAKPTDPSNWPWLGLVVGLILGDLAVWTAGWWSVRRLWKGRVAVP
jgi:hypothetical protein